MDKANNCQEYENDDDNVPQSLDLKFLLVLISLDGTVSNSPYSSSSDLSNFLELTLKIFSMGVGILLVIYLTCLLNATLDISQNLV